MSKVKYPFVRTQSSIPVARQSIEFVPHLHSEQWPSPPSSRRASASIQSRARLMHQLRLTRAEPSSARCSQAVARPAAPRHPSRKPQFILALLRVWRACRDELRNRAPCNSPGQCYPATTRCSPHSHIAELRLRLLGTSPAPGSSCGLRRAEVLRRQLRQHRLVLASLQPVPARSPKSVAMLLSSSASARSSSCPAVQLIVRHHQPPAPRPCPRRRSPDHRYLPRWPPAPPRAPPGSSIRAHDHILELPQVPQTRRDLRDLLLRVPPVVLWVRLQSPRVKLDELHGRLAFLRVRFPRASLTRA